MLSALAFYIWSHIQPIPDKIAQATHSYGQTSLAYLAGYESREVTVDGCTTRFLEKGQGPTVVLLHGLAASKEVWLLMALHFSRKYHFIIPDLPGHGQSCRSLERRFTVDALDTWFNEFHDALHLGTVHIVGNSVGSTLGGWFAWQHPEKVSSLTLMSPAGIEPSPTLTPFMETLVTTGHNRLLIEETRDMPRVLGMITYHPVWYPPGMGRLLGWEHLRNKKQLEKVIHDLLITREALKQKSPDIHTIMSEITAPTQIIWGVEDNVMHVSGADTIEASRPDIAVYRLPEMGHSPMMESPADMAELVEAFIQKAISPPSEKGLQPETIISATKGSPP